MKRSLERFTQALALSGALVAGCDNIKNRVIYGDDAQTDASAADAGHLPEDVVAITDAVVDAARQADVEIDASTDAEIDAAVDAAIDAAVDAAQDASAADAALLPEGDVAIADSAADAAVPDVEIADSTADAVVDAAVDAVVDALEPDGAAPELDTDNDGIVDRLDNCPTNENPNQLDSDRDGLGNVCDPCRQTPDLIDADGNPRDADLDGIGNACDNCIANSNEDQNDVDGDGVGDACDNAPGLPNYDQSDRDHDRVADPLDNCVTIPNPGQEDADHDGEGFACDPNDDDASIHHGADEIPCDNIDQNGDGLGNVTQRFPDGTVSINGEPACDCVIGEEIQIGSDIGACEFGRARCFAVGEGSQYGVTDEGVTIQGEVCDGLDNNCDGLIDEAGNPRTGGACECNDGEVRGCGPAANIGTCRIGVQSCEGGAWSQTCEGGVNPAAEVCDGLDNNCDGITDETFSVGSNCNAACGAGHMECSQGQGICSTSANGTDFAPVSEIANGADDDCNGLIDDVDLVIVGSNGQTGRPGASCILPGVCGEGQFVATQGGVALLCSSSALRGNLNPLLLESAVNGLCDGLDNDCDGVVDEGCNCVDGESHICGSDVGACATGVQTCENGRLGGCVGAQGPVAELCDGVDNSCDGQIDEGISLGTVCAGACGAGIRECADNGQVVCSTSNGGSNFAPRAEVCNGIDDDCNGFIDDHRNVAGEVDGWLIDERDDGRRGQVGDPSMLPGVCGAGHLRCSGLNSVESSSVDRRNALNPADREPANMCDGLDNDCDGTPDDGCVCVNGEQRPGGTDVGACVSGVQSCVNGRFGLTVGGQGPVQEICDGLDNDCDGVIDNGFDIGEDCVAPGECGQGVLECNRATGTNRCSTAPGGSHDASSVERCDGLDNDCDRVVDDGQWAVFDGLPGQTAQVDTICRKPGICGDGFYRCVDIAAGSPAVICSSVDNRVGSPADNEPGNLCDGLDNNCNGTVDESCVCNNNAAPVVCGESQGECSTGTQRCVNGLRAACEGEVGPSTEICDRKDNNCDGQIDNARFHIVGTPADNTASFGDVCYTIGNCTLGTLVCANDNELACSTNNLPRTLEIPGNGIDDDCDENTAD